MRVGIIVPQGWTQEYVGVEPRQAWQRTRSVARRADDLGFESIWMFDHFHTVPTTVETTAFELFTTLSAGDGDEPSPTRAACHLRRLPQSGVVGEDDFDP